MTKPDLTIIYYTANLLNDKFANNIRNQLKIAAAGLPIISVSKKPIDYGLNIIDKEPERSIVNVYKVILEASRLAESKFVALAEDDTLYSPEHFYCYLPEEDVFAYNLCRWNIYTWKKPPLYSLSFRKILANLIAPRKLLINTIEERFNKFPNPTKTQERWITGEPGRGFEKLLGMNALKTAEFYSYIPNIVFSHPKSFGFLTTGTRKRAGKIRALSLPYWGTAEKVMKDFYL